MAFDLPSGADAATLEALWRPVDGPTVLPVMTEPASPWMPIVLAALLLLVITYFLIR